MPTTQAKKSKGKTSRICSVDTDLTLDLYSIQTQVSSGLWNMLLNVQIVGRRPETYTFTTRPKNNKSRLPTSHPEAYDPGFRVASRSFI